MDIEQYLKKVGFDKLPSLDPAYFDHRTKSGYLVLVQNKRKQVYQLHTINAHRCLETTKDAIEGYYADRAKDLKAALEESAIDDWDVYFRPNGLYPGLKGDLRVLFAGYQSLNTRRSQSDPSEITWAYQVYCHTSKRGFTIPSKNKLWDSQVVAAFLTKWRSALEQALKRKSIDLGEYYIGCAQLAMANKAWLSDDLKGFSITEVEKVSGKPREEVIRYAAVENFRQSAQYHKALTE